VSDPFALLRPVLLTRRGRRWAAPPRPRPALRSLLRAVRRWGPPRERIRRECDPSPLGLALARRPLRLLHAAHPRIDAHGSSTVTTVLQTLRVERDVLAAAQMPTPARPTAAPAPGAVRPPSVESLTLVQRVARTLVRESSRFDRLERVETTHAVAGARGPAGPAGPAASAPPLPMPLARPSASAPAPASSLTPAPPGAPALELVPPQPAPAFEQPAAPDVDQITTQVLRRIERRAIAQRERMGGGV